jgi:hypothetical protein
MCNVASQFDGDGTQLLGCQNVNRFSYDVCAKTKKQKMMQNRDW